MFPPTPSRSTAHGRPGPRRSVSVFATVLLASIAVVVGAVGAAQAQVSATDLTPLPVTDPAVTSGMSWHLDEIGARSAWRASLGYDVIVAVVDTGTDAGHPDLAGQIVEEISCIGAAGDPERCEGPAPDSSGHGTHVAALVAARTDDAIGVAGVAPRASILSIKALSASCEAQRCTARGDSADVAAGVLWALDRNADIINLSLTSDHRIEPVLSDAIAEAWDRGAVVVMAAGTAGSEPLRFDTREALVVTATDRSGSLAPYAPDVDVAALGLAAPGGRDGDTDETCHVGGRPVGIISAYARHLGDGSGYACLFGTSMATAQVSGGIALLMSMGYPRDGALERIFETTRTGPGLGGGRIDLVAAVAGELPIGVRYRHDPFENGTEVPMPEQAPTVGPFAVPEPSRAGGGVPVWVFMAAGAILAAGLAEAALRATDRRRAASEPAPVGPERDRSHRDGTDGSQDTDPASPYPTEPPYRDPP